MIEDLAFTDYYKDDFIRTNPEVYKMMKTLQGGLQYFLFFQSRLKDWCSESHKAAEHEVKQNKILKDAIKKQKSKIRKVKKEIENLDLRAMHYDIITEVLKPEGAPLDYKKIEERKLIRDPYLKVAEKLKSNSLGKHEEELLESADFELSLSLADRDDRKSVPFEKK